MPDFTINNLWKRNVPFDTFFSDEWKAQCLADYYQSIANDVAEIESVIDEVSLKDELDDRIEELQNILGEARTSASLWFALQQDNLTENLSTIKTNTDEFKTLLTDYFDTVEGEIFYSDYISVNFPNVDKDDFIEMLNEHKDDQLIYEGSDFMDILDDLTDTVMQEHGLENSYISLTAGNIKLKNLIERYAIEVNLDIPDVSGAKGWNFADEAGDILPPSDTLARQWNIDGLKSELSALSGSMSLWGTAVKSCVKESISDRLIMVENAANDIKNVITDKYGEAKAKFDLMKTKVVQIISDARTTIANVTDTLTTLFAADESYSSGETLDQSPLAQYTGINPTTAFRIKGVGKVLGATVYICAQAGKAVWNLIETAAHKLFMKVRPWINAVLGTPEDLKICDNNALSYETELFTYNRDSITRQLDFSNEHDASQWASAVRKYSGKWIRMSTLFATTLIKINSCFKIPNAPSVGVNFDYRMKPKCVNSDTIARFGLGLPQWYDVGSPYHDITRVQSFDSFLSQVYNASHSSKFYADNDETEAGFQSGFAVAIWLQYLFAMGSCNQMAQDLTQAGQTYVSECVKKYTMEDLESDLLSGREITFSSHWDTKPWGQTLSNSNTQVVYTDQWQGESWSTYNLTNLVFIKTVSGCADLGSGNYSYDSYPPIDPSTRGEMKVFNNTTFNWQVVEPTITDTIITPSVIFLGNVIANNEIYIIENHEDPEFIPYSLLTNDFDAPRYEIRTDEENIKMATTLAGVLVTVAIVAAAFFVTKGAIKIFKTKKYAKLKSKVGQYDNAMWTKGFKMNNVQAKAYARWNRKLDKMGNLGVVTSDVTNTATTKLLSSMASNEAVINTLTGNNINESTTSETVYSVDQYINALQLSISGKNLNLAQ